MKLATVFKYLFILLLPSVLLSFAANSIIFALLALIAVTQLRSTYPAGFFKTYLFYSSFMMSILLALFIDWTNQESLDTRHITKRLAFFLMPFIICYSHKIHQKLALKFMVYFMSLLSFLLIVIGLIRAYINKGIISYGNWDSETTEAFYANKMLLNWGELSYKRIFLLLDMHPSYYAFFSSVALLLILFTRIVKLKKWQKIALVCLHALMIVLVSSKAGIISLVIIIIINFSYQKQPKQMILGFILLLTILITALSIPSTRLRFQKSYKALLHQDQAQSVNNASERLLLWNSLETFSSAELLLGVGLKTSRKKVMQITGEDKNMHNQFLQALVSAGLVGLLLLAFYIFLPLYFSRNLFTYAFLAVLLINLNLENMMDRIWGIMMISFFYSLFMFGHPALFSLKSKSND